jgi:hypothetical protein
MPFILSWLSDKIANKSLEKAVNVIRGQCGEDLSAWNFLVKDHEWQSRLESFKMLFLFCGRCHPVHAWGIWGILYSLPSFSPLGLTFWSCLIKSRLFRYVLYTVLHLVMRSSLPPLWFRFFFLLVVSVLEPRVSHLLGTLSLQSVH